MENEEVKKGLNPGGRPNLADDEVLSHRLVTRVNVKDFRDIDRDFNTWKSGRAGRIADFLREIILNRHSPRQQRSISVDKEQIIDITQTLHSIRQHLKHIDTNYNQTTKRINSIEHTGKLYYEIQTSKAIIEKLGPLVNQIDALVKVQTEKYFSE